MTKVTAVLGNNWPIIQGNTTDQSLLAIDSELLHEHSFRQQS